MSDLAIRRCVVGALLGLMMAFGLLGGGCTLNVTDDKVERISVPEAARRVEKDGFKVLMVDARDEERYKAGHIPGAKLVLLPDVRLMEPTPQLEGYKMLIVYGDNPGSGTAMAMSKRLMEGKHKNVRLMEDGFDVWKREGLPVVEGE